MTNEHTLQDKLRHGLIFRLLDSCCSSLLTSLVRSEVLRNGKFTIRDFFIAKIAILVPYFISPSYVPFAFQFFVFVRLVGCGVGWLLFVFVVCVFCCFLFVFCCCCCLCFGLLWVFLLFCGGREGGGGGWLGRDNGLETPLL